MVHAHKRSVRYVVVAAVSLLSFCKQIVAQQDPPSRVARLNFTNGNVSMEPAGVDDWAPADLNRPFTTGDYLYADQGAEAELHLDEAVMRIGSQTSFGFLNLDDQTVQLKLTEGDMYIRIHNFGSGQVFEVDTPNAAVTLLEDGIYRFRVASNGSTSFVVVRTGQAQITGGGQAFTLNTDNSATLNGVDQLSYDIELAPQPDEFDQWAQARDAREAQLASSRYLPPTVIGSEDLGAYGSWQDSAEYGPVWYPQSVNAGWAPYQIGHWAWIDPWGWTWIDSQPWGFAPFHYGRWAYIGNRWGWCPGPIAEVGRGPVVRPYYAPAMVAWFGGAHWGVSFGGGSPNLGWVPLGWGEVYTPSYQCSPRYFNNVNVYNTRVVNTVNITNVYHTVYVNKTVYNQQFVNVRAPNAVMSMPQSAFVSGRPVREAAIPVRQVDVAQLRSASVIAPPVAPTRQSVFASAATRPAPKPAAQVIQRQVVARIAPPPAPASFAAQQSFLQQHVGQVANQQVARQAAAVRPVSANVKQAPAATAIAVRPGEHRGNEPVASRPGATQLTQQPVPPAAQTHTATPVQTAQRPAPAQVPAPAAHGVPPNLRQANPPAQSLPPTERPAQSSQTFPANRNAQQPVPQEQRQGPPTQSAPTSRQPSAAVQQRAQPADEHAPPPRPQPPVQQRAQPAEEHAPAPARPQPQVEQRTPPEPQRVSPPERQPYPPRAQEQQQTQPNHEEPKPSAPATHPPASKPNHDEHPNNDKKP